MNIIISCSPDIANEIKLSIDCSEKIMRMPVASLSATSTGYKILSVAAKSIKPLAELLINWVNAKPKRSLHLRYHENGEIKDLEISGYDANDTAGLLEKLQVLSVFPHESQ